MINLITNTISWFFLIGLSISFAFYVLTLVAGFHSPVLKPDSISEESKTKSLTVIVPARNESKLLEKCLKSLKKQTFPRLKVHIAINNSNDEEISKMKKIIQKFPEERFSFENYGKMDEAWISGKTWVIHRSIVSLRDKLGDFILFLDADVQLSSEYALKVAVKYMNKNKQIGLMSLHPRFIFHSFVERLVLYMIPPVLSSAAYINDLLYHGFNPNFSTTAGWFLLIRKSDLDEINKNKGTEGLNLLKTCPFSDDIATGRLFIMNKKKTKMPFGGYLIQNTMFSNPQRAILGMKRFGTNTYGAMKMQYKIMGLLLLLFKVFPYFSLIFLVFVHVPYFSNNILDFFVLILNIGVLLFSLIAEYHVLNRCNMKGALVFFLTPIKLFFFIFGVLSIIGKKPDHFIKQYNTEVR